MTRWRASYRGRYYYINTTLDVQCLEEEGFRMDDEFYNSGNYFETKAEAEEVAKKFRAVLKEHHNRKGGKE